MYTADALVATGSEVCTGARACQRLPCSCHRLNSLISISITFGSPVVPVWSQRCALRCCSVSQHESGQPTQSAAWTRNVRDVAAGDVLVWLASCVRESSPAVCIRAVHVPLLEFVVPGIYSRPLSVARPRSQTASVVLERS